VARFVQLGYHISPLRGTVVLQLNIDDVETLSPALEAYKRKDARAENNGVTTVLLAVSPSYLEEREV
jgi:hypothetical protein